MAGGFLNKSSGKKSVLNKGGFSSEFISEQEPQTTPKFSLRGILGLNQTVEIGQNTQKLQSQGREFFSKVSHLQTESQVLFDNRQKELQKTIESLQLEIKSLTQATKNLDLQVELAATAPIIEASDYQLSFLTRIKTFIANFRKNVDQASIWLETFQNKSKKKKGAFWSKVKDKKHGGGEQYLFSNEHSAARSVA